MTLELQEVVEQRLGVTRSQIEAYCQRWQIVEFALFGSILRDDFRPDSDVDVLVTFSPTFERGLTEMLDMKDEIQDLFQRKVDLIVKSAIEHSQNWLRRKNILTSAQTLYLCPQIETPNH